MKTFKNSKFNFACIRLTVFYVLIAMVISISFSVAIFNISAAELGRGLGRQNGILRDLVLSPGSNGSVIDLEHSKQDLLEESSSHLSNNLIYFNLLILLLSATSGYFLAKKTLDPIEKAVEAQNRFTADASHELRTPLTAMKTEIEVAMRDKKLDFGQAKKLLASNLEEIGKLESLSNALLTLTRYDDKLQGVAPVNLEEVIIDAYEKIEVLAQKKNIIFKNHLLNVTVVGDQQGLRELFVILLDNAVKYSPEKSTISIKMTQDKKNIFVAIKDQGMGIKATDLLHIFERFYRADLSRSKEAIDGNGLGLSIAKNIVKSHDGRISVESHPGKGSTFTVVLPNSTKE